MEYTTSKERISLSLAPQESTAMTDHQRNNHHMWTVNCMARRFSTITKENHFGYGNGKTVKISALHFVNDSPEIAFRVHAGGVHLGGNDLSPKIGSIDNGAFVLTQHEVEV